MAQNYTSQLQALLRSFGFTHEALARRLGVTRPALSRWLHGVAAPHPFRQRAIAALYKELVGLPAMSPGERARLLARARAMRRRGLWEQIRRDARLLDDLLLEHTYNSNAIEGSTLSRRETEAVIFDKVGCRTNRWWSIWRRSTMRRCCAICS